MRAGSYLPTQRGTSSASLPAAAPDRRPNSAPDLLPVAYRRSGEHDEERGLAVVAAVLTRSQHHPAGSGLLLTAVAAGAFIGSLLRTWRPIAIGREPLVTPSA